MEYRICSKCGKTMYDGYVIEDEMEYYCDDKCLYSDLTKEEFLGLYEGGSSYWSEFQGGEMRYIINNKWMDTEKSELILREEFGRYEKTLYVTPKKNYFIQKLDCIRGGSIGLSCTRDEAIELTKKYSPYEVKKYFPEILSELEEG